MAKFNVNTTITAPETLNVNLVREDYYKVSNIFRTFFEFSLALTSALIGSIISVDTISNLHWISLGVTVISSIIFLLLAGKYRKDAHS